MQKLENSEKEQNQKVQEALARMSLKPFVRGPRSSYGLRATTRSVALRKAKGVYPIVLYYDHDDEPLANYFEYSDTFAKMVGRALITGVHPTRQARISVTRAGDEYFVWAMHTGDSEYTLLWRTMDPPDWVRYRKRNAK